MALTQMQLIQSLGEAMSWFERELGWGVQPTELRHLCGRIGELYAALITNGQMAPEVNQRGYDVVSGDGERISVKTTAKMNGSGHISFNANAFVFVDRVIVLRMNRGCKNFCVNGQLAGNCRATRSDDDRSKESRTQGVAGQSAG